MLARPPQVLIDAIPVDAPDPLELPAPIVVMYRSAAGPRRYCFSARFVWPLT
jgi:hypothetical protein